MHTDLALDVRYPDVARNSAEVDRRIGWHLHAEFDVDAPAIPLAVLDAQLDAVTGRVGFDESIRQPLLRLFRLWRPRVLEGLDFDALAGARRDMNVSADVRKHQRGPLDDRKRT